MTSVAGDLRREQLERFARMSAAERLALSIRLGEEGLAEYMAAHRVDRAAAVQAIRRSRRVGRRPSPAADADR